MSEPMATTPSLVDLGRQLMDEARDLIRKEIELAKVEIIALVKTNALALGLFAGAAVVALVFLIMLQVAIIFTLPFAVQWIVAWCLAAFWLIVLIVLALVGKSKLKFEPPEKTIATIKGDIEWAKGQIHSNGKS
jgi:uncharacterized membrane protein YqjE